MPLITVPEAHEDSSELHKKLSRESQLFTQELVKRREKMTEVKDQISKLKALEKQNKDIKAEFYTLLTEKITTSEITHSEVYLKYLEVEIEAMKAAANKGEKKA